MGQALEFEPTHAATRECADTESWHRLVAAAIAQALLEIELIEPGAVVLYHEGHLAFDMAKDPDVAGIAAAFYLAAVDRGLACISQCAPTARTTSGGRIHPDISRFGVVNLTTKLVA